MNTYTGEVIEVPADKPPLNTRDWVQFNIGEELEIKGIKFRVHDVGEQRLVLKFVKKA